MPTRSNMTTASWWPFRSRTPRPSWKAITRTFAYFAGVPRSILYGNTRIAVKEITGEGERKPTEAFSGLQSHYLFAAHVRRQFPRAAANVRPEPRGTERPGGPSTLAMVASAGIL